MQKVAPPKDQLQEKLQMYKSIKVETGTVDLQVCLPDPSRLYPDLPDPKWSYHPCECRRPQMYGYVRYEVLTSAVTFHHFH